MVGGIINVAFGRHQCERQHPNFTKFATITCLPLLPVIFPTWTKRLFDFQWRRILTFFVPQSQCFVQIIIWKMTAADNLWNASSVPDRKLQPSQMECIAYFWVYLLSWRSVFPWMVVLDLWPSCDSWCSWRWTSRLCSQATMFASSEQTLDSWSLISITMYIVSK